MGWFGWLVVLGLVVFGWFAYRELKAMEDEIRQDIENQNSSKPDPGPDIQASGGTAVSAPPQPTVGLEQRLLKLIAERPGLVQSRVYDEVSEFSRKQVQQTLLELDRNRRIRRERARGSYLLYPG